jgi:DNA ligase-1
MITIVSNDGKGRDLLWENENDKNNIKLYKTDARNSTQVWKASCKENIVIFTWGKEYGKMQEKKWVCDKGKNIGRSNETTPSEQAWCEAQSKAFRQLDKGYSKVLIRNARVIEIESVKPPLPMLANDIKKHLKKIHGDIYIQPKLDGCRCVGSTKTGELFSRQHKQFMGLDHISEAIKVISSNVWLDGELYRHGVGFQTIMSLTRKTKNHNTLESLNSAKEIEYHVYDCVLDKPFKDRMKIICDIFADIPDSSPIKFVQTDKICSKDIDTIHARYIGDGYEGSIIRYGSKPYEMNKRSCSLLKKKDMFDSEYEVVYFNEEKKSLGYTLGSVTLKGDNGVTFSARPAMTQKERKILWDNRDVYRESGWMATIQYFEMTDDGVPRFPVLRGMRSPDDM